MRFLRNFIFFTFIFLSPLKAEPTFDNLTILVCSCDKYAELWSPFFTFLFNAWPSLKTYNTQIPILLMANKETYSDPRVTTICVGEDQTWSKNLLKVLPKIKTDYVLILLEDYFISQPVNESRLFEIFEGMQRENAVYVQISCSAPITMNEQYALTSIPGVYVKSKFGLYRPSLQASLWKKDQLEWLIKPSENIWEFERKANDRSQGMREPFLSVLNNLPVSYINAVAQGVWNQSALDYCKDRGVSVIPKRLSVDSQYPIYFWYIRTFKPAWKAYWDQFRIAVGLKKPRNNIIDE